MPSNQPPRRGLHIPEAHVDTVYNVIANRRTAFDTMMWQVPALGLAAQAFLLTIAYGDNSSCLSRCISGLLSVLVALVAIQTMLKHRANEKTDTLILAKIEAEVGIQLDQDVHPHSEPEGRGKKVGNDLIENSWPRQKSARLWVASLSGFALAGGIAVVVTLLDSSILRGG